MNKVFLIGNLANDPEYHVTANGTAVCRFALAVNRRFKNANGQRVADFHRIVAWRTTAENCRKYLAKGKKVAVVGELQNSSYTAQDGSKRVVTDVIADEVEFLSANQQAAASHRDDDMGGFEPVDVDDEELPF